MDLSDQLLTLDLDYNDFMLPQLFASGFGRQGRRNIGQNRRHVSVTSFKPSEYNTFKENYTWVPSVDVVEHHDYYFITIELPVSLNINIRVLIKKISN